MSDREGAGDPPRPAGPGRPARELGLTDEEHRRIVELLGRDPRPAELAMYGVMWSEHCSYKSSRAYLRRLPCEAPWVVVGPGENAGVVDLAEGWLAALRIESHNHPSFVEPYQGAATGVGGILRDVFTMGARPIALWDALRFGPLEDGRNRYLFEGVVAGIAGYGNAVGVPTVGGEVELDDCYAANPLVNVMALGLLRRDGLVLARAAGEGNLAVLLGASTGRDGIGGVSTLASAGFHAEGGHKRPAVQVGDPFEEKKLIETCLELYERGLAVGVQDLGGAGLTCAASETAARAGTGMELDLDRVHLREEGMSPAEILTSESQERMLAIVRPDHLEEVLRLAEKWEITASPVGTVTGDGLLRVRHRGEVVAEVPAGSLSDQAPVYRRPRRRPDRLDELWSAETPLPERPLPELLLDLLDAPGIGDTSWVHEQYDHMLFLNTVIGPGGDAALLRLRGTDKGLAVSVDGHGRRCFLDPRRGAARLVYEAALNVAVVGARPLAVVDNLNFGSPEDPEVMWDFAESVEGIAQACEALGLPVVGGNVSFYNETDGRPIHPTPVVGLLGLADPLPSPPPRWARGEAGMELWLFGPESPPDLAGGAGQALSGGPAGRPAAPDPAAGAAVIELARILAHRVPVLHDLSDGGLGVAAAELCIASGVGCRLEADAPSEVLSEAPHRFLAALPDPTWAREQAAALGVPARPVGTLGGAVLDFGRHGRLDLARAAGVWRQAIPRRVEGRGRPG